MNIRLFIYIGYYLLNLVAVQDILAFWITLPTMLLVVYNIWFIRNRYVTVEDMIAFIVYLFFVVQPLQQIDHGHIGTTGPVSSLTYHDHYIVMAGLMASLFYLVFTIGMHWSAGRRTPPVTYDLPPRTASFFLLTAIVGFVGYVILFGGLENVLAPRTQKVVEDVNVLATGMLALQTASTIVLSTYVRRRIDTAFFMWLVAMLLLFIPINPFNAARFIMIACYVPMLFILMRGRISTTIFYVGAMFVLIVIFPIVSLTSRFGSIENARAAGAFDASGGLLNLPFIDVFDMLVECARYTAVNGYTHGWKLIGLFFFYVPRAIWTGKPTLNALDIGSELADDRIAGTANLSMFVVGDGYRDLGLVGVAITAVLLVLIVHFLIFHRPKLINGHPVLRYLFICSLPILMRGPLGAVLPLFFMQNVWMVLMNQMFRRYAKPLHTTDEEELRALPDVRRTLGALRA